MSDQVVGGPFDGLPQQMVDTAREAKCSRCQAVVVDCPSASGAMMFNYYVPVIKNRERGILCGECGLLFREFVAPALAANPLYIRAKKMLQDEWSNRAARG